MQQKLRLYTYFRSSTSHRVRIVLNLKQIEYEPHYINLLQQENKNQEHLKELPNQAVPTLHLPDNTVLIESMAICEYLEEKYPEYKLFPEDLILKTKVRGFCEIINSGIHPYQNLILFEWVEKQFDKFDRQEFVVNMLKSEFQTLERLLLESHGKYSFGDNITLADCFLVPQVAGAIARFKLDISKFPTIEKSHSTKHNLTNNLILNDINKCEQNIKKIYILIFSIRRQFKVVNSIDENLNLKKSAIIDPNVIDLENKILSTNDGPSIQFFDEPSTGVDPITRRFLWRTLKIGVQLRKVVLFQLHILLMKIYVIRLLFQQKDKFIVLLKQELRMKYGDGYDMQLREFQDNTLIEKQLQSKVKDINQVESKEKENLVYHIPSFSFQFGQVYFILNDFVKQGLIKDFSVNQSSLESVFLYFSQFQHQEAQF